MRLDFRERATQDREILSIDCDAAPIDLAEPGDHAIAWELLVRHAEVGDIVGRQSSQLLKAVPIQQGVDTLTGRQLAPGVLVGHSLGAAAHLSHGPHLAKVFEFVFH